MTLRDFVPGLYTSGARAGGDFPSWYHQCPVSEARSLHAGDTPVVAKWTVVRGVLPFSAGDELAALRLCLLSA
eukprot:CAMPEP_0119501056 /NCGR_PEP_ID=MMETSP1344-20130328/23012_1 /TAXON_ID=236787 /ORGANISM="Florenciella parvula, Strain CCMP2471" /LENGTH=72 /DNA_ID=CAMNT_0007537193 /DNA_START=162 /DNA_END=380 /DNA_ORIENTATION=-